MTQDLVMLTVVRVRTSLVRALFVNHLPDQTDPEKGRALLDPWNPGQYLTLGFFLGGCIVTSTCRCVYYASNAISMQHEHLYTVNLCDEYDCIPNRMGS